MIPGRCDTITIGKEQRPQREFRKPAGGGPDRRSPAEVILPQGNSYQISRNTWVHTLRSGSVTRSETVPITLRVAPALHLIPGPSRAALQRQGSPVEG